MKRMVKNKVRGFRTTDGAGVNLVRVLGNTTAETYDPILMLDSFDSTNPEEYTAGFPMHPHRGIETISLVVKGNMVHKDSLGNEDGITDGEVQWMTAGSGILHEEKLPASDRMLGVQLWLNMPRKYKMAPPEYHSIKKEEIKEIPIDGGILRLISGQYKEHKGFMGKYLPMDYYHIILNANNKFNIETENDKSVLVFLLSGDAKVAGETISEKTAVKLTNGDSLDIESLKEDIQILFISSDKLEEPVSWGGPIVMNTREELDLAFRELSEGSFLKEKVDY
ncbi:pirin family protein [Terrisporobacter petrolearius]|uniref:pirin family protein n=1 Tax=Terrisporobacter petrolearius TaxID=1460447 RepID=UPI001D16D028|nr:pirin family protein [Terrisporobacter petrolearius]MCC3864034.1 pirin family protein [Terrisporobacter petrolearius]